MAHVVCTELDLVALRCEPRREGHDAGVAHEYIQSFGFAQDLLCCALDGGEISQIELKEAHHVLHVADARVGFKGGDGGIVLCLAPRREVDTFRPVREELANGFEADAGVTAGDEDGLVGERRDGGGGVEGVRVLERVEWVGEIAGHGLGVGGSGRDRVSGFYGRLE